MIKWQDPEWQIFKKPTVKVGDRCRFTRYARYQNIPTKHMPPGIVGVVKRIGRWGSVVVLWDGYKAPSAYHPSFISKARALDPAGGGE